MAENNQYRETLKDYARKMAESGVSIKQAKQEMITKGYPKEAIEAAIHEVKNNKKVKILPYILGFIVLALIVVSIYILITNNPANLRAKVLAQTAEKELEICKAGVSNRCIAIANKDVSFCEKIEKTNINMNLKENCKEIIPLLIYYTENVKEDKCKNIPDNYFNLTKEEAVNDCREILNALEKDDENLCSKETCNFAYNIAKANSEKNIVICDKIKDATAISDCKMLVSSSTNYCDYSACDEGRDKFIADGIKNS